MTHPSPLLRADAIALLPPADLDDAYENRKYIQRRMNIWPGSNSSQPPSMLVYPRGIRPALWTGAAPTLICRPDGGPGTEKGPVVVMAAIGWPFPKMTYASCQRLSGKRMGCCHDQLYAGTGRAHRRDHP